MPRPLSITIGDTISLVERKGMKLVNNMPEAERHLRANYQALLESFKVSILAAFNPPETISKTFGRPRNNFARRFSSVEDLAHVTDQLARGEIEAAITGFQTSCSNPSSTNGSKDQSGASISHGPAARAF